MSSYTTTPLVPPPKLIEPQVYSFFNHLLYQSHQTQLKWYNTLWNIGAVVALIILVGGSLFALYRGKPTKAELEEREQEKTRFIFKNLQEYEQTKLREQQELITGLPQWSTELDDVYGGIPHIPRIPGR